MAHDYFLKIDGVTGESTDKTYANYINVLSWSWGDQANVSFNTGSGAAVGKPIVQPLTLAFRQSSASATLLKALNAGTSLRNIKLVSRRAGEPLFDTHYLESTVGFVAGYAVASSPDDGPLEQWNLVLRDFKFTYRSRTAQGTLGTAYVTTYDTTTNRAT